jgi:hypothetical protein
MAENAIPAAGPDDPPSVNSTPTDEYCVVKRSVGWTGELSG